jgi:hypothetical protein
MGHPERRRRRLKRTREDLGLIHDLGPAGAGCIGKGGDAGGAVALSPGDHRGPGDAEASRKRRGSLTVGACEHNAGAQDRPGGHLGRAGPGLEGHSILIGKEQGSNDLGHDSSWHYSWHMSRNL